MARGEEVTIKVSLKGKAGTSRDLRKVASDVEHVGDEARKTGRRGRDAFGDLESATKRFNRVAERASDPVSRLDRMVGGLRRNASRGLGVLSLGTSGVMGGIGTVGMGLGGLALGAGAVGAAFTAMAGLAGKQLYNLGAQLDEATDTIRVGTGATGQALADLRDDFDAVAKTTPASFEDVSTAVADLNTRLGLTGDPLRRRSKQFLELSRITGGDVATNIETLTRLFGDMGVAAEDQEHALDAVFRASQATGVTVDSLAQMAVQYGAPMRQMGFAFEDTIALLGKFEKEGVNTELVMGSMRIALGKFAKAGEDPADALQRITDKIKNAGSAGEANAMAFEVFGARAGADMAAAIREGRFAIDDLLTVVSDGSETIMQAADDTADASEKWQMLRNRIGLALEPIAAPIFDAVGDGLDTLTGAFDTKLPDIEATLGGWSDEVSARIGGAAKAIEDYGLTRAGIENALTSLTGSEEGREGVVAVLDTFEDIGTYLRDDLIPWLQEAFDPESIAGYMQTLRDVVGLVEQFGGFLQGVWSGVLIAADVVGAVFVGIVSGLVMIAKFAADSIGWLADKAATILDAMGFEGVATSLRQVSDDVTAWGSGLQERMQPGLDQLTESLETGPLAQALAGLDQDRSAGTVTLDTGPALTDVGTFFESITGTLDATATQSQAIVDPLATSLPAPMGVAAGAMAGAAAAGGSSTVQALDDTLTPGAAVVANITGGFAGQLAAGLNPILEAVGKPKIIAGSLSTGRQAVGGGQGRAIERASGGRVPGTADPTGADDVLARLTRGEWVMPVGAVAKYGPDFMRQVQLGRYAAGGMVTGDTQGLHPEFMRRLGMWASSVGQPYNVGSGYRSIAEQQVLYSRWLRRVPGQAQAAPPGRSNHNFGLASDGPHWRGRNPGRFGLVYPMSFEPWHVEPIGARSMRGLMPDGGWPGFVQLPKPPGIDQSGIIADAGAAAMEHAYKSAEKWATTAFGGAATEPTLGTLDASATTYDSGGVLKPGFTLAHNGTGHDETVVAAPPAEVAAGGVHFHGPVTVVTPDPDDFLRQLRAKGARK